MARVKTVAKAQKDQGPCRKCRKPIVKGQPYKWFANLIGRTSIRKVFCADCRINRSDITTSDKLASAYSAQETLEEQIGNAHDVLDLEAALNDAANSAREVADEYRESISNMPDSLQCGSVADDMEEKASALETWADELESAACEVSEMQDDVEEAKDEDAEKSEDIEDQSNLDAAIEIAQTACDSLEL